MTEEDGPSLERAPRVLVCRGCCCGSTSKFPEVDHDGQLEAVSAVARTRVVDCVDECAYANVMIVRPAPGRSIWLGRCNSATATEVLCEWLADGAPEPLPPILEIFAIDRSGGAAGR
ncbi:MAG: (2Fe-2S) ferredoxin domain-containing protein [Actinomycetota bacterium]